MEVSTHKQTKASTKYYTESILVDPIVQLYSEIPILIIHWNGTNDEREKNVNGRSGKVGKTNCIPRSVVRNTIEMRKYSYITWNGRFINHLKEMWTHFLYGRKH